MNKNKHILSKRFKNWMRGKGVLKKNFHNYTKVGLTLDDTRSENLGIVFGH